MSYIKFKSYKEAREAMETMKKLKRYWRNTSNNARLLDEFLMQIGKENIPENFKKLIISDLEETIDRLSKLINWLKA